MPLHTTIHHDGRAKLDGSSPKTGIHPRVDSLVEKLRMQPAQLAANQRIVAATALWPAILQELEESRSRIDLTYRLEAQFPPETGAWKATPEVKTFADERARAATRFTAALFLTAWKDSTKIKLPSWLKRETATKAGSTRAAVRSQSAKPKPVR
jgi:hypothetical protein